MNYEEMLAALKAAREVREISDHFATDMARLLKDCLRNVNSETTLRAFKTELRNFDSRSGRWSTPK